MENFTFKEQNTSHKWRTEIPNILFSAKLTATQFFLYSIIKKSAGDDGGCTKSIKTLSELCNCSERHLQKTLKELCQINPVLKIPLIILTIRKKDEKHYDTHLILITDIWAINFESEGGAQFAPPTAQFAPPPPHSLHQGGAQFADKEEPIKNNPNKKNIASRNASHSPSTEIYFDFDEKKFINITPEDIQSWKLAYPNVNLDSEIPKSVEWLLSNPTKAKKKNWRRYLTGWLSRDNDKRENKKAYLSQNTNDRSFVGGKQVTEYDGKW
jgi:hypothetical protein